MSKFLSVTFAILLTFAACSKAASPVLPDANSQSSSSPSDLTSLSDLNASYKISSSQPSMDIWASVVIRLEPSSGNAQIIHKTVNAELRHYKVSYFLTPPRCIDCIAIQSFEADTNLGIGKVIVSLRNPTAVCAYDVRGIVRIPDGSNLRLLNADGYTSIFPAPGFLTPSPFKTYAKDNSKHAFAPGKSYFESFNIKTKPGLDPTVFNFLVTAGYPNAVGDVSIISGFMQSGQLIPGSGTTLIRLGAKDLQNDITGICLRTGILGFGDIWMDKAQDGKWEAQIKNLSASPGLHYLKIDAFSPNSQNAVTSQYFRAVVFHNLENFRSSLLSLVNHDRISNGLSPLSMSNVLNTVAQSHAQDMAELKYFSHTNLDGWTPWDRMAYYGAVFQYAGENIAVGQDSPTQVEADWMNSPGHKQNILGTKYKQIGIGIAPTQSGDIYAPGYYWVQVFSN